MAELLYSEAAEAAVIGSALRAPDVFSEMRAIVEKDHFWSERNQTIYQVILSVYEKHQTYDAFVILETLRVMGKLEAIGGEGYLYSAVDCAPDPYNWRTYAAIVVGAFFRRRVSEMGNNLITAAGDLRFDVETLLNKAQSALDGLRQTEQGNRVLSISAVVSKNREKFLKARVTPNAVQGLRTRITSLDKAVGGFVGGRLYLILGNTNMGKSSLATSIIRDFIMYEKSPGFIVSTESEPGSYVDKIIAAICKIPFDLIETGQTDEDQSNAVLKAYERLEASGSYILDQGSPTPQTVRSLTRTFARLYGLEWLVADSISKFRIKGTTEIYETSKQVANEMQDLARETSLPLIATCQVKPAVTQRSGKKRIPASEDTAGGADAPNNADVVLSIYNHNHYVELGVADADPKLPAGTALVRVTKHRWRKARSNGTILQMVGGAGFYDRVAGSGPTEYEETKTEKVEAEADIPF